MSNNQIIAFSIGIVIVVIVVIIIIFVSKEKFAPSRIGTNVQTIRTDTSPFNESMKDILKLKVANTLEQETQQKPVQDDVETIANQVEQIQQQTKQQIKQIAQQQPHIQQTIEDIAYQEQTTPEDILDRLNQNQTNQMVQQTVQQAVQQQAPLTQQQIKQSAQQSAQQQIQKIQQANKARPVQQTQQAQQAQQAQQTKENFFALGDRAYVDEQGDIGGSRIMTNGLLNQSYDEIKAAIQDNKPLKDNSTLGVSEGDGLETAYSAYKGIQEVQENDPTAVRSSKEMADIAKQISAAQNNSSSNILSRAGSSKAKIKMDPLGTVGVCDKYTTPERDRNHKIYSVAHAVYVPGFELDTNRINQELTSSPGWSKNFASNTISSISSVGSMEGAAKAAQQGGVVQTETFSSNLKNYVSY